MSAEQNKDYIQEIEGQMRAAEALIESLEEEVTSLRQDLEQASVALKAAQEEVTARGEALEEKENALVVAERKAREASSAATELRIQGSNEQLSLTNQHISELARLQDRFQDQLRAEIESALSAEDREALVEEHRQVQRATEQKYEERITTLERSYEEAQERLRKGEQEFDRRRAAEIENLRKEAEEQKRALERKLQERLQQQLQEALRSATGEHEAEIDALRKSFADRERDLQTGHQKLMAKRQAEFEADREELESRIREIEERDQAKVREIKGLAENREQELRKTHSARLAEVKAETERRIEALQSQREADNKALRKRHEQDLAQLRAQYEKRMSETVESSRLELWTVQEKLEGIKLEKTSEAAVYRDRLRELETALQVQRPEEDDTVILTQEIAEEEPPQDRAPQETVRLLRDLQTRVEELEAALAVSENERDRLAGELRGLQESGMGGISGSDLNGHDEQKVPGQQTDEPHTSDVEAQERVRELESRLLEAREESRRNAEKLQHAVEELHRLSDPDRRLRSGISAFNASEHTRHVASISKSLGLPKVHTEIDETTGKPIFTFVWEELSWRRYIADPAEDLQEPRVYLLGSGDEPEELENVEQREPNARIDARGQIILGVQAR